MKARDVALLSLKDTLEVLRSGDVSRSEILNSYYSRVQKLAKPLNVFITPPDLAALTDGSVSLPEAQQSTDEPALADSPDASSKRPLKKSEAQGTKRPGEASSGQLFGIPVSFKDNWLVKDTRTTAGSRVLENFIAPYTATAAERLLREGAVVWGKTNMDAWGHGSSGENSDFGPTLNPWDTRYTPGGSSSGSAVAVAADLTLVATGTDTGGSIRLPAAYTGVVGIKPTYGRVSRYGIVAMASSTDSIGHLTKTVWDAAYVLSITAGRDKYDATTSDKPVPAYHEGLRQFDPSSLKVGVISEFMGEGIDEDVLSATEKAISKLKEASAQVVEVSIPETRFGIEMYYILMSAEVASNLARYDGVRYGRDRTYFGMEAKRRIMLGTYVLSDVIPGKGLETTYAKVAMGRTLLVEAFKRAFEKVDVLITPVAPTLPFKLGELIDDPLKMYMGDLLTVPVSIAGLPALVVPTGTVKNAEGVLFPAAVQIIGPWFREDLLFKVGAFLEDLSVHQILREKLDKEFGL